MPLIVAIIVGRAILVIGKRNLTEFDKKYTDNEFMIGLYSVMLGLLASALILATFSSSIKIGYKQIGEYNLIAASSDNKYVMSDISTGNFDFVYDNDGTPTHVTSTKTNQLNIHKIKETEVGYVIKSTKYKYNTLYTHLLLFPYSFVWDFYPEEEMIYNVYINPTNILITKEEASN